MKAWAEVTTDDLRWAGVFLYTRGKNTRNLFLLLLGTFGGVILAGIRQLQIAANGSGWSTILTCAIVVGISWLAILGSIIRNIAQFVKHPGLLGRHEWELSANAFIFRGPLGETSTPWSDCRLQETRINAYVEISPNTFVIIPKRNLQGDPGFLVALRKALPEKPYR